MGYITVNGHNYHMLGRTSKMAIKFMKRYVKHAAKPHLMQNYTTCSDRKKEAWLEICSRLTEVRITGAGSSFFSCAGRLVDNETGDEYFVIETPSYSYAVIGGWKYLKENY